MSYEKRITSIEGTNRVSLKTNSFKNIDSSLSKDKDQSDSPGSFQEALEKAMVKKRERKPPFSSR